MTNYCKTKDGDAAIPGHSALNKNSQEDNFVCSILIYTFSHTIPFQRGWSLVLLSVLIRYTQRDVNVQLLWIYFNISEGKTENCSDQNVLLLAHCAEENFLHNSVPSLLNNACAKENSDKTAGVVNDSLGQSYSQTNSDHHFHLKFVSFCEILKSWHRRTDVGHL